MEALTFEEIDALLEEVEAILFAAAKGMTRHAEEQYGFWWKVKEKLVAMRGES